MSKILDLFTEEDMAELKKKVIDVIVEEVRQDIRDSYTYVISPDNLCEEIQDQILNEVVNEIKEEYKECVKKFAEESVLKAVKVLKVGE